MNDGGPAFPRAESENYRPDFGMSLRDWLAGMAMQGWLSAGKTGIAYVQIIGQVSYEIADAMLAAREAK